MEKNVIKFPRQELNRAIPKARIDKMHRLISGCYNLYYLMYQWNNFARVDDILNWLIAERLCGDELQHWMVLNFQMRPKLAYDFIIMRIDHTRSITPTIIGKDWNPNGTPA